IKNPMDFFTINSKLNDNQYTSAKDFEKDICLIFCNCYTYNNIGSEIYKLGEALELAFNKIWAEKIIFLVKQKEKSKRVQDNDTNSSLYIIYFNTFFAFILFILLTCKKTNLNFRRKQR
ncbi:Bromodomain-containing protein, partial [Rhizophagus irregularis DAOM 181602=DAOM 197198]